MARLVSHRLAVALLLIPFAVVASLATVAAPAQASKCGGKPGDVDHDNYADVMVQQPARQILTTPDGPQGAINLLRGSAGGLTLTGNQYFDVTDTGFGVDPTLDNTFGAASALGFFNGDCYADAVVGVSSSSDDPDDAMLFVFTGTAEGLSAGGVARFTGNQLHTNAFSIGDALAVGDFNGDGYDDLAVGAQDSGSDYSGGVVILYGSSGGLTLSGRQWFSQGTTGVPGSPGIDNNFGAVLAAGHFTGGTYDDLAISAPFENIDGHNGAGSVTILRGSSSGLTTTGSQRFTEDTAGMPGVAENGDGWGSALTAADLTGDGKDDLVVGAPDDSVDGTVDAGAVTVILGSTNGLTTTGSSLWTQHTSSVPGALQSDQFGQVLSSGDYNHDGKADIAIGAPDATVDSATDAGEVVVLRGNGSGLTTTGATLWSQETTGVAGTPERGDQFGESLQSALITGTAYPSLIIGVPFESDDGYTNEGGIEVLPGGSGGLTATGSQFFDGVGFVRGPQSGAWLGY
jgi:hypothetical protein